MVASQWMQKPRYLRVRTSAHVRVYLPMFALQASRAFLAISGRPPRCQVEIGYILATLATKSRLELSQQRKTTPSQLFAGA